MTTYKERFMWLQPYIGNYLLKISKCAVRIFSSNLITIAFNYITIFMLSLRLCRFYRYETKSSTH